MKSKEEIKNVPTETLIKDLREDLKSKFPGINYSMAALGQIPRPAPIEITLSGSNLDSVLINGNALNAMVEKIPGAANVRLSVEGGSLEYIIIPEKDKMQRLGITTDYLELNLRTAFTGNDDATLTEDGTEYPVRVSLDEFDHTKFLMMFNSFLLLTRWAYP